MALDVSFTLTDKQQEELTKIATANGLTLRELLIKNMNVTNLKLKTSNSKELPWDEKLSFFT